MCRIFNYSMHMKLFVHLCLLRTCWISVTVQKRRWKWRKLNQERWWIPLSNIPSHFMWRCKMDQLMHGSWTHFITHLSIAILLQERPTPKDSVIRSSMKWAATFWKFYQISIARNAALNPPNLPFPLLVMILNCFKSVLFKMSMKTQRGFTHGAASSGMSPSTTFLTWLIE